MDEGRLIAGAADARAFLLAGNATFTLVSKKTGVRFTFKVRKAGGGKPLWWVALLRGPQNEVDFSYIGFIRDGAYMHGRNSKIGSDAPSARAIAFACEALLTYERMPATLEFWHEGRCGRCGRKLTVPESIERGLGPECAGRQ